MDEPTKRELPEPLRSQIALMMAQRDLETERARADRMLADSNKLYELRGWLRLCADDSSGHAEFYQWASHYIFGTPPPPEAPEDRCPDCEYTPSGTFAHPCQAHGCSECGHIAHDAGECGMPDPHTGWCECLHTADGTLCPSCGSTNTEAMSDGDDGKQLVCRDCRYGT